MEITYAIANGLMEANLPGYIQISSNNLRLSNPYVIAMIAKDAAKLEIPIGLHLDHGKSFEDVKRRV
ncbi:MAG: class II fructose-bisphosphate aldolase [Lachnospiraceae bacterium]